MAGQYAGVGGELEQFAGRRDGGCERRFRRCGSATERVLVEFGFVYGGESDDFKLELDQRTAGGASDDQRVGLRRGPR